MAATAIPIDALPSINPATGEVLGHIEKTPPSLLPEIVSRERIAQDVWAKLPIRDRCEKLRGLRDRIMASRLELADAVVRESGKPRVEALFADVFVALDSAEYWSGNVASALRTRRVPHHSTAAKAKRGYLAYQPLGVIAIISSWNYPLAIPLSQIIPAIAAGNAVVSKTSDLTPQCGSLIVKLFIDARFPGSLVTVVQGGGEVGQALIDAWPDKVLFTGSVTTGRRVAEACARKLIPSVLELGGKDAMIVLADADLEVASSAALWGGYTNCGQVCLSVERLFVEQAVAEKFLALCVEKTKKLRIGPGSDPATDVGPLIRPQHDHRGRGFLHEVISRRDIRADPSHSSSAGCQRGHRPGQRFTVCAGGQRLDKKPDSRNGFGRRTPRRRGHGKRCHQLFRHCGSPARRVWHEWLGPHPWQSRPPRNGAHEIH